MVILDTNILIDHLRVFRNKTSLLQNLEKKFPKDLAISTITVQELYVGKSTKSIQNEQILLAIIGPLKILPYTYEVAQKAGEIARDLTRLISFPDAAIAATAIINSAQLYTLNKKDFEGIENLELV